MDIKLLAAEAALRKMVEGDYFDICTIDRMVEMLGIKPDAEAYSILRTLHCVHYNKMGAELLSALPELIHKVLDSPRFDSSRINIVEQRGGLRLVKH